MRSLRVVAVATAAVAASATVITGCDKPCRPSFTDRKCSRGGNIDFRFAVGSFDECNGTLPFGGCGTNPASGCSQGKEGCTGYLTHFFCGEVDKFSSFVLEGSKGYLGQSTTGSHAANTNFEAVVAHTGKLPEKMLPEAGQRARVRVVGKQPESGCTDTLYATFLIYNATLSSGTYKYKNREPVGNGFVSTCDGNSCLFDSSMHCLKDENNGLSNCAKCGANELDDIRILTSFYGTDNDGQALLSGSSNPLNFRQFALDGVASDLYSHVKDFP